MRMNFLGGGTGDGGQRVLGSNHDDLTLKLSNQNNDGLAINFFLQELIYRSCN